jgi:hypothetical protein
MMMPLFTCLGSPILFSQRQRTDCINANGIGKIEVRHNKWGQRQSRQYQTSNAPAAKIGTPKNQSTT